MWKLVAASQQVLMYGECVFVLTALDVPYEASERVTRQFSRKAEQVGASSAPVRRDLACAQDDDPAFGAERNQFIAMLQRVVVCNRHGAKSMRREIVEQCDRLPMSIAVDRVHLKVDSVSAMHATLQAFRITLGHDHLPAGSCAPRCSRPRCRAPQSGARPAPG